MGFYQKRILCLIRVPESNWTRNITSYGRGWLDTHVGNVTFIFCLILLM